jgi:hypothetical protein
MYCGGRYIFIFSTYLNGYKWESVEGRARREEVLRSKGTYIYDE